MSKISKKRKVTYYIGIGMMIIGFILFISIFFNVINYMDSMNMSNPLSIIDQKQPSFKNAITGMLLMISGAIIANVGAKGAAGSGIILDPEKQREDLKPFNEAKGEMINDIVSHIDVLDKHTQREEKIVNEVVKIRCRNCSCLNDEDARFCKECGKEL